MKLCYCAFEMDPPFWANARKCVFSVLSNRLTLVMKLCHSTFKNRPSFPGRCQKMHLVFFGCLRSWWWGFLILSASDGLLKTSFCWEQWGFFLVWQYCRVFFLRHYRNCRSARFIVCFVCFYVSPCRLGVVSAAAWYKSTLWLLFDLIWSSSSPARADGIFCGIPPQEYPACPHTEWAVSSYCLSTNWTWWTEKGNKKICSCVYMHASIHTHTHTHTHLLKMQVLQLAMLTGPV